MFSITLCLGIFAILNTTQAALYVTFPTQGDKCAVSQPCQIKWTDDSRTPSTSSLGETAVDLVMGSASNLQAVQNLGGVSNPSVATALTFTPVSGLSPTQQYAIRFTPKSNPSAPIFSTFFTITGGSGTATPLPAQNSASAGSTGSTGSPSPMVGSQAPNASSTTPRTTQLDSSNSKNTTASAHAENSSAGFVERSALAMIISMATVSALL